MPPTDVAFTFDPKSVVGGVNKIQDKMTQMTRGFAKSARSMSSSVAKGIVKATVLIGSLVLAFKGVKKVLNAMPEVGQAFGIAKDIIMKNLLWPLRKAVMPMLQRMLDWVRDNRTAFIKWGQVIANIFITVVKFIERFIQVAKRMWKSVSVVFKAIFGDQIKSLDQFINIMLFKIAAALEFMAILLEPIMEGFAKLIEFFGPKIADLFKNVIGAAIGIATGFIEGFTRGIAGISEPLGGIIDKISEFVAVLTRANEQGDSLKTLFDAIGELAGSIVKWIVKMADSFLEGFLPAISQIMTPLNDIIKAFQRIFDAIFGGREQTELWSKAFKFLGTVLGFALQKSLEVVAFAIEAIAFAIEKIVEGIKWVVENWEKIPGFLGIKEAPEGAQGVIEAAKTPRERELLSEFIGTSTTTDNRQDVNIENINVVSPPGEDPWETGVRIMDGIKKTLQNEGTRQGF